MKNQLKQSYDFSSHQIKPAFSSILKQLQEEYAIKKDTEQSKKLLERNYNIENIETVYVGIEVLRRKQGDKEIDFLLQHPESNDLVL